MTEERSIRAIMQAVIDAPRVHKDTYLTDVRVLHAGQPDPHFVLFVRVYVADTFCFGSAVTRIAAIPTRQDDTIRSAVDVTIQQAADAGRYGDRGPWYEVRPSH